MSLQLYIALYPFFHKKYGPVSYTHLTLQSKPKILVLKMRELVYTGIFLFLAVVLIVLLVLMFRTEKAPEKRTSISTERYTAGVYSSPVTLGDTVVDVTVTVDPDVYKRQP